MRFITIAYNERTADNGKPIDLYEYLLNELNNRKILIYICEADSIEEAAESAENFAREL